jgi:subtilisin-like proprotein convertase family protein
MIEEGMSAAPVETSDDLYGKRKSLFIGLGHGYLLFQLLFPEPRRPWSYRRVGLNPELNPGRAKIISADQSTAGRPALSPSTRRPSVCTISSATLITTSINEMTKPWMANPSGTPTTGYARDYGIQQVWREGIRGQAVRVGVNDSGLVRGHADFDYTKVHRNGYLFNKGQNTRFGYRHGTAVASVIGARSNGLGVVGIANECDLWTAYSSFGEFVMNAISVGCDVVNNSWIAGIFEVLSSIDSRFFYDLEFSRAVRGRNGLGLSLVFGTGNDRSRGEDTAVRFTTNHENVIAVAAVDINTRITDFSTPGESVHIAALGRANILASADDLTGVSILVSSGTSYAAPFVSGVVALMYQANPGLGLRDVQAILAYSASLPQDGMAGFRVNAGRYFNGGGLNFSRDYGFGVVNALHAVRLAQSWFVDGAVAKTATNRQRFQQTSTYQRIGAQPQHATLRFNINDAADVEHVRLSLDLDVSNIRDLRIALVSPRGTESVLFDNYGDEVRAFSNVINLGSRRFWGEKATGEWSVNITSARSLNDLRSATLVLAGSVDTQDDRYVYTDAFNAQAAADARRLLLEDRDGGTDTFNAACVSNDALIDLRAGEFRFGDGPRGRIAAGTVIEIVVGGDGNDRIIGGVHAAHAFYGGRGDDTLRGGVGADI